MRSTFLVQEAPIQDQPQVGYLPLRASCDSLVPSRQLPLLLQREVVYSAQRREIRALQQLGLGQQRERSQASLDLLRPVEAREHLQPLAVFSGRLQAHRSVMAG